MNWLRNSSVAMLLGAIALHSHASPQRLLCEGTLFARDGKWNFMGKDETANTLIGLDLGKKTVSLNTSFLGSLTLPLKTTPEYHSASIQVNDVVGGRYLKSFSVSLNRYTGRLATFYDFAQEEGVMEFIGDCVTTTPKF